MKENRLMDLSMDFAVKTIDLVKRLKEKKRPSSQTKLAEAERVSARISEKPNMRMENRISFQNCKSP
jgi:hypothetical protein